MNYIKPVIMLNEDLAEGVYTASGEADCWTIEVKSDQEWNGRYHTFRVNIVHSNTVQHISTASTSVITFSLPVKYAQSEGFDVSYSGNTVTIVREQHANAYQSGDNANFLLEVEADTKDLTEALAVTNATISCTKSVNVQGNGADGN